MGWNQQGTLCPEITWRQFSSSQVVNRDLSASGHSCDSVEIHRVLSAWMFCALGISSLIPNVSLPRMLLPEQVLLSSHTCGRGKNQAQNSNSSVLTFAVPSCYQILRWCWCSLRRKMWFLLPVYLALSDPLPGNEDGNSWISHGNIRTEVLAIFLAFLY